MNSARLLQRTIGLVLVVLSLAGCGGVQAEPTSTPAPPPVTATPVQPTATATPVQPTATATPVQPTATATPVPPTPTNTPEPTPTGGEVEAPTAGSRGEWELTVLSVEHRDSITFAVGEATPDEGQTFLVVEFLMKSLGEAEMTTVHVDWFQVTDQSGNTFPALSLAYTGDFSDIFAPGLFSIEFPEPSKELGELLAFAVPASATGFKLEFTGDLDEFPPIYLGEVSTSTSDTTAGQATGSATGEIRGILVSKDTEQPIEDFDLGLRAVLAEGTPLMFVNTKDGMKGVAAEPFLPEPIRTDDQGRFTFEGIPPGGYVIEHSFTNLKDGEGFTIIVTVEAGAITDMGEVFVVP